MGFTRLVCRLLYLVRGHRNDGWRNEQRLQADGRSVEPPKTIRPTTESIGLHTTGLQDSCTLSTRHRNGGWHNDRTYTTRQQQRGETGSTPIHNANGDTSKQRNHDRVVWALHGHAAGMLYLVKMTQKWRLGERATPTPGRRDVNQTYVMGHNTAVRQHDHKSTGE